MLKTKALCIQAKVIEDSYTCSDTICHNNEIYNRPETRIVTFELHYPRFIHSELLTHRVFSKNSSSSRAIPWVKMKELVINNFATPTFYGKNKSGMQASESLNEKEIERCDEIIGGHFENTLRALDALYQVGLHKQHLNRYLEPFAPMKTILTGTDFKNFFALRCDFNAQPEIQELAYAMKEAMEKSTPKLLVEGEWHLPFVCEEEKKTLSTNDCLILSVGRCASVSYRNQVETLDKAREIYNRLTSSKPIHASPFEHQATPIFNISQATHCTFSKNIVYCGNMRGWQTFRNAQTNNVIEE